MFFIQVEQNLNLNQSILSVMNLTEISSIIPGFPNDKKREKSKLLLY